MAKLYSKNATVNATSLPKKETIHFILNYSKALNYITVKGRKIEFIAN
jgi:hypothetical protein